MCHILEHALSQHAPASRHPPAEAWLRAGKTVELRERDKLIARIVPEQENKKTVEWPDFAARAKKIFGDRSSSWGRYRH
jgi:hypothetical protein